jgi:transcriptional antiterminator NusG
LSEADWSGRMQTESIVQESKNETITDLCWFAVSVRSRHEFVVREELQKKGIESFLPSVIKLQQWRDRKKNVEFPVFPGYLFVSILPEAEHFVQVIKTRGTVGLVSLEPGHPTPVAPAEIEALRRVLASGRPFDVYPGYRVGTRVRIRRGPLCGAEGVLARKDNLQWFFVNVEILGRSVGLRVLADDVELIEPREDSRKQD